MHVVAEIVGLVLVVLGVTSVARRLDLSAPLCLVAVGVLGSYLPGVPDYQLNPEFVLVGLLPPLLYATAIRTSLIDVRNNRGPILLLSVGLVGFTTIGVGVVTWLVIPGIPLAAGMALGAVVAPPDAVAATAVARRVGMPRRIVRILEGESLLNDATALVALRTAIAALAGTVSMVEIGGDFLLAAGGGVVVGGLVGWLGGLLRTRLEDQVTDTALSMVIPFVAYIPAELIHGSGVLAVVVAGLFLGHQTPRMLSGPSRLASRMNWQTIQFILENTVFLLIGLQLRGILAEAARSDLGAGMLVVVCAAVLAATLLTRVVWMFGIGVIRRTVRARHWPWSHSAVISWAGMRGVVTLAAAFVLPADTPERAVLVLAAFVVVAGTLAVQGSTLPALVRRLRLPGPDPAEDALQEAALLDGMTRAGLARLEELRGEDVPEEVVQRLRDLQIQRSDSAWEQLGRRSTIGETPSEAYRKLRKEMLEVEREVLIKARKHGSVDHEVLSRVLDALDIEESMVDRSDDRDEESDRELRTPAILAKSCEHLVRAPEDVTPNTTEGCEECLVEGTTWVHLRLCLTCGHVGCCDSSPRQHGTKHFDTTKHSVVRSFEPGESWRWCFVDRVVG
jgi:Na+/H+ antiporter